MNKYQYTETTTGREYRLVKFNDPKGQFLSIARDGKKVRYSVRKIYRDQEA
jgi:predicted ester cyclase